MAEPATNGGTAQAETNADGHDTRHTPLTAENLDTLSVDRQRIEADSVDGDSAYGESTTSSFLTSIASDVTRGLYENGRRYLPTLGKNRIRLDTLAGITLSAPLNTLFRTMNQKVCLRSRNGNSKTDNFKRID